MVNSGLRETTEPAVFVTTLLSNMTYPNCAKMAPQLSEYSRVFVLLFDWIIKTGNFTGASTKICQKRQLFPRLHWKTLHYLHHITIYQSALLNLVYVTYSETDLKSHKHIKTITSVNHVRTQLE